MILSKSGLSQSLLAQIWLVSDDAVFACNGMSDGEVNCVDDICDSHLVHVIFLSVIFVNK